MKETASPSPLQLESSFLPDSLERSKIQRVRSILGEAAGTLSDEQLETFVAQCDFLISSWLDEYERTIFEGKTLKELL